jgi:hypothetical protein
MEQLSEEEIKYRSIIVTQNSLVELGAIQEKNKKNLELIENRYKYLENTIKLNLNSNILKIKINDIINKPYIDRTTSLIQIFDIYNEYYIMTIDLISNLEKSNNKLEDYYNSIREENNITNKEYDKKQQYWENRVYKLRDKCIAKNNEIVIYKQKDLYNTYNIIGKNIILFFIILFNIDLLEFIFDYIFFSLGLIIYSVYSNSKVLLNHKTKLD